MAAQLIRWIHDEPVAEGALCAADACEVHGSLRCRNCGKEFCPEHIHQIGGGAPVCTVCLTGLLRRVAELAIQAGRAQDAILELGRWRQNGCVPEADYLLALLHAEQSNYSEAIKLLVPLIGQLGAPAGWAKTLGRIWLGRAAQYASQGMYSDAALATEEAVRLAPSSQEALSLQLLLRDWHVVALVRNGALEEGIHKWEAALDSIPSDLKLIHNLGLLYYRHASELAETWDMKTSPGEQRDGGGTLGPQIESWKRVVAYLATSLASCPPMGQQTSDVTVAARDALEERLMQDFRNYAARAQAAGDSNSSGLWQELETLWGIETRSAKLMYEYLRDHPVDGWIGSIACGPLMLERLAATPSGRRLVAAIRRAVAEFEGQGYKELHVLLSPMGRYRYLIDTGRLAQAIVELREADGWPQAKALLGEGLTLQAREHLTARDFERALATFEEAASVQADLSEHLESIAEAAVKRSQQILDEDDENYPAASRVLERARALTGQHDELDENLGAIYAQLARIANNSERYDEAETHLRAALKFAPDNEQVRHFAKIGFANSALALIKTNPTKSIDMALESWRIEPDADMITHLGFALLHEKRPVDAVKLFQTFLRFDPQNTDWSDGLIVAFREQDRFDEAIQVLKSRVQRDPNDTDLQNRLHVLLHNYGIHLANRDRFDQSIDVLKQALSMQPSQDTRTAVAQVLVARAAKKLERGDRYGARQDLQEAGRYNPGDPDIRRYISIVQ